MRTSSLVNSLGLTTSSSSTFPFFFGGAAYFFYYLTGEAGFFYLDASNSASFNLIELNKECFLLNNPLAVVNDNCLWPSFY